VTQNNKKSFGAAVTCVASGREGRTNGAAETRAEEPAALPKPWQNIPPRISKKLSV